ncbi:hypothetical protein N8878_05595 [Psychromonas sp.]|nr:hypothetical protein [Psychromonas sp.]
MNFEVMIIVCWVSLSLATLIFSVCRITRCKKIWLSLLLTYFIAQPFAWTILAIGNGGGSIIIPIPDLVGVILFFTGVVTYEFGDHSINACLPPSPLSTLVTFVIVFFIARRFKSVAYYHWFRKPVGHLEVINPED